MLRQRLRQQAGSREERDAQSEAICRHILNSSIYQQAQTIGGYLALPREADVNAVLTDALARGKTLVLPRTDKPPHMTLRRVERLTALSQGRWGIPEPDEVADVVRPDKLDLLLVPLEGVDLSGHRLGKGGGYYDALLGQTGAFTMGIALSWQWVDSVPCQAWDKPVMAVCDAEGIHLLKREK